MLPVPAFFKRVSAKCNVQAYMVERAVKTKMRSETFQHSYLAYFVSSTKIDMLCCKLRTLAARNKGKLRSSIIARYDLRARLFPICKAQHPAAPFQHNFDLFCPAPKNRHKLQSTVFTTHLCFAPFYHSTPRLAHFARSLVIYIRTEQR